MTLRQIIIAGMNWLLTHPKAIVSALPSPLTRAGVRSTYNTENSVTTFDTDLMTEMRSLDATYNAYDDTTLQGMIDSELPASQFLTISGGTIQ